ncbi:MAG: pitrilysin family protein [Gemmatimonadaceae bacterium]
MQIPIETYRLDNGLTVTLSEDHTAPIVAVNLWYHVGSANERQGLTGFAHLFEHMLFQGSEHVGTNQHFETIQRAGGTLNGSTWLERTNYFETVPSNHLESILWLEADRMGFLLPGMTQQKLDLQREVVKNERRWSMDNQPYGTWWEKLPALCFPPDHPFHHSLIGSMEDLSAASIEDVAAFFRTYYTPDNAVLSIAGDFEAGAARTAVARYFGPIPRGPGKPPLREMSLPPVLEAPVREIVHDDVALNRVFHAYRSPVFGSEEYYAASTCAAILGMRRGSRLYRSLVREQQLAQDTGAFTYDLAKGSDLFVVDVTARPGVNADAIGEAMALEVDSLRSEGVTVEEVGRAQALIESDFIRGMQSAGERADQLSKFATFFGEPGLVNEQLDRYRSVRPIDVNEFARSRLGEDNRASLVYVPRIAAEVEEAAAIGAEP